MYQGSSLLLDFFTHNYGKIRLVARGARSNKTSLQMFQCLNISYKGRSDLKNLRIGSLMINHAGFWVTI